MALTVYSPGDVLTASSLNANLSFAADSGGLVLVQAETTVTAAASFTADNVFTSDYTNYRVMINYTTSSTGNIAIKLRASAVNASTNYNIQQFELGGTTFNNARNTSQTEFRAFIFTNGAFPGAGYVDIFQPQLAAPSNFLVMSSTTVGAFATPYMAMRFGNHSTASAFDGIALLAESGTFTGTVTIYGYSKTL